MLPLRVLRVSASAPRASAQMKKNKPEISDVLGIDYPTTSMNLKAQTSAYFHQRRVDAEGRRSQRKNQVTYHAISLGK